MSDRRSDWTSFFGGRDPAWTATLICGAAFFAIALIFTVGIFVLPFVIAFAIFKFVQWYKSLPEATTAVAVKVDSMVKVAEFPSTQEFFDAFTVRYENACKAAGLTPAGYNAGFLMYKCAIDLYEAEAFNGKPRLRATIEGGISDGEYRDELLRRARKAENPERTMAIFAKTLSDAFRGFTSCLPPGALEDIDRQPASKAGVVVNLIDMMPDTRQAVANLMAPFYAEEVEELGLFRKLRHQLKKNVDAYNDEEFIPPQDTNLDPIEAVDTYLINTPLLDIFTARIPWELPQELRFEHQWIVTPQGGGKTTFIQHQLIDDIKRVANDEASVVVMDSQGDLINLVSGLEAIPPEKLIIIEPDPEFPLALNLFDLGKSRMAQYDSRTRQMLDTNAVDLLTQVFDGLLGTATTPKQTTLFRHAIRLCRAIPGATMKTLMEVINTTGTPYPEIVATMPEATRDFFTGLFTNTAQFKETKQEIGWRLSLMLENETFAGMFSQKESKLDLFTELNSSKIILINTDKSLLKEERTEIFGRFFIALLLQAAQERALIERRNRLPTFVYIDEAQDYIKNDRNIMTLCDQARKMRVSLCFANQRVAQLDAKVIDTLTNVAIKCARAVNDSGAHTLARNMGTTPDFIQKQPVGSFAISLRNAPAMSIKIPPGEMEAMPRRSQWEMTTIRASMREKYSVPYSPVPTPRTPQPTNNIEPVIPTDTPPDQGPTTWPR